MVRRSDVDERVRERRVDVERDGDDLELREELSRAVPATRAGSCGTLTSSPTRRAHLLAVQRRQRERCTVAVGQRDVGHDGGRERASAALGPERPQVMFLVVHERHAQAFGQHLDREPPVRGRPAGQRYADVTLAKPLWFGLPTGAGCDVFGRDGELFDDHELTITAGRGSAMEHVRWSSRPRLRTPVVIAAFAGRNDAGEAASSAGRHLADVWATRPFATLDAEDFYDFSATQPQVRLVDGVHREIVWPSNEFSASSVLGADLDVVLVLGTEPAAEVANVLRRDDRSRHRDQRSDADHARHAARRGPHSARSRSSARRPTTG